MDLWLLGLIVYVLLAICTFIPTFRAITKKIELHPGGASFKDSQYFSDESKGLLEQNYSRIYGTLTFWKNAAAKYYRFHIYCLVWVSFSSALVPVVASFADNTFYSKIFLTSVSFYSLILLSLNKIFQAENHYKAYRNGESEFYDLNRRLLDRPKAFGVSEPEQLEKYFIEVERIRKTVRDSEIESFPTLDSIRSQVSK